MIERDPRRDHRRGDVWVKDPVRVQVLTVATWEDGGLACVIVKPVGIGQPWTMPAEVFYEWARLRVSWEIEVGGSPA